MEKKTIDLVTEFLKLQNLYSFTKRTLVTADRYTKIAQTGLVGLKDYENSSTALGETAGDPYSYCH